MFGLRDIRIKHGLKRSDSNYVNISSTTITSHMSSFHHVMFHKEIYQLSYYYSHIDLCMPEGV